MLKQSVRYFLLVVILSVFSPLKSLAQVVPDNTLGSESSKINSIDELRSRIEGGAIRGDSLFHSFEEFGVTEGASVDFANPDGIANIFSRVTGSNVSEIFGSLGVDGAANLFLMNPNGFVFGENAAINVNGSFLATTAETINFSDGSQFSSVEGNSPRPTLTVSVPTSLGFGSNPGEINIRGEQNNVFFQRSFRVTTDNLPSGIEVDRQQNISLIGGNITFNGGGLQAPGGNIELHSIGGDRTLKLLSEENWFVADISNISDFGDISFNNAAYLDVSDSVGGNINLSGRQIVVDDGSVVLANTSSSNGAININASELLEIKGSSGENEINVPPIDPNQGNILEDNSNFYSVSVIGANVLPDSTSQDIIGTDINIDAKNIRVLDAGQIRTASFSNSGARAGNVNINAEDILVSGANNIDGLITSKIVSRAGVDSQSNSGNVNISTSLLRVEKGGRIEVNAFNSRFGGAINIKADRIFLEKAEENSPTSSKSRTGLSASPGRGIGTGGTIDIESKSLNIVNAEIDSTSFRRGGNGTSGDIKIDTEQLGVFNGGTIISESAGTDAANIQINAQNIELNGTRGRVGDFIGGISSSTRFDSVGNGGDIQINTDSLKVLNGSIIRAISLGEGDGGNINIDAESIEVAGFDRFSEDPVDPRRTSKINTGALKSNGGNLTLNSDLIRLENLGTIQATTEEGSQGGNIMLNTVNLQLLDQGQITASAGGEGNGGNITIDSDAILGLNNSDITANAVGGNGGNIEINTERILGLESRQRLTSASDITASSEFGIDGTVTINSPESNIEEDAVVVFRNYIPQTNRELISGTCLDPNRESGGKLVYVGRGGVPENPNNFFDDEEIVAVEGVTEDTPVSSHRERGSHSPPINSGGLESQVWSPGEPMINANAVKVGADGQTYLVAETQLEDAQSQVCASSNFRQLQR